MTSSLQIISQNIYGYIYKKVKKCFYSLALSTDADKLVFIDRTTIFYSHQIEHTWIY